jgi:heme-degrading monooxygenase HmoA
MIMRCWRGWAATPEAADAYTRHLGQDVLPRLRSLPGYRGARLLRREVEGEIELRVLTTWDSLDAVRAFAGDDYDVAVVEWQARAALSRFDARVEHLDVVLSADG